MGLCAEPTGMFFPGIKIAEVDTMSLFRLNDNSVYKKKVAPSAGPNTSASVAAAFHGAK